MGKIGQVDDFGNPVCLHAVFTKQPADMGIAATANTQKCGAAGEIYDIFNFKLHYLPLSSGQIYTDCKIPFSGEQTVISLGINLPRL